MVLQLQRDPKTGNLMMLNNQPIRPQTVIQMDNQSGPATGQQVANHGYHPGRHLHHQLQLKHLPQVNFIFIIIYFDVIITNILQN